MTDSNEPQGKFICDNCGDVVKEFKEVDPSIQDQEGWVFLDEVTVTKCCESTYYEDEGEEE